MTDTTSNSEPTMTPTMVKIHVTLIEDGIGGESLWAEDLGEGRYRIDNIPFFVDVCTLDDVVSALVDPMTGVLEFISVTERHSSGHWQMLFNEDVSDGERNVILDELIAAGARTERAQGNFFVMAATGDTDAVALGAILDRHAEALQYEDVRPGA